MSKPTGVIEKRAASWCEQHKFIFPKLEWLLLGIALTVLLGWATTYSRDTCRVSTDWLKSAQYVSYNVKIPH